MNDQQPTPQPTQPTQSTPAMQASHPVPALAQKEKAPIPIGPRGLILTDLDSLWRVSNYIAKSGLAPKGIETPEAIFTAIQLGAEIGLTPMAALQNIAVINGRPAVWGDAMLAICRTSSRFGSYREYSALWCHDCEQEMQNNACPSCSTKAVADHRGYVARATRTDQNSEIVAGFNIFAAKRASLWGKSGPWTAYPTRMLKWRARGFCLRDAFGDALKGMKSAEEAADVDEEEKRFRTAKPTFDQTFVSLPPTSTSVEGPVVSVVTPVDAAPVNPVNSVKPPAAPSVHEEFSALLSKNGITFDQFKGWGVISGNIEAKDADSIPDLDAMDGRTLRRFLSKPDAFIQGVRRYLETDDAKANPAAVTTAPASSGSSGELL